jgi:hypothetical protein
MRSASLPVVDQLSSLDDALRTMRKSKRSGIVVRKGRKFLLHTAKEVASARDKGSASRLNDLRGTQIHVPAFVLTRKSTTRTPGFTELLVNSLKKSGKKYGLVSTPSARVKKVDIYARNYAGLAYLEPGPRPQPKTSWGRPA